jgi:biopolymer transport protein ExbB
MSLFSVDFALIFLLYKTRLCALLNGAAYNLQVTPFMLIDLRNVLSASPSIYLLLGLLSILALAIWIYTLFSLRSSQIAPTLFVDELQALLEHKNYAGAHTLAMQQDHLLALLLRVGFATHPMGAGVMIDAIRSEGKRVTTPFWQRLSLLSDIIAIAPMLGLLGTVVGMFYAFYDVNRSIETIHVLFDGLGLAVGTTVCGLIVAIMTMLLTTTLKYRVIHKISVLESEMLRLVPLMPVESNDRSPLPRKAAESLKSQTLPRSSLETTAIHAHK